MTNKDRQALWLVVLSAVMAGLYWYAQVSENDRHLEEVAACADSSAPETGAQWREAWEVCWGMIR